MKEYSAKNILPGGSVQRPPGFELKSIGRTIPYSPKLASLVGGMKPAIFLSQLIYWCDRTADPERWFHKSAVEWEAEVGITYREQKAVRRQLRDIGLLDEDERRFEHKMYFRVNLEALNKLCAAHLIEQPAEETHSSTEAQYKMFYAQGGAEQNVLRSVNNLSDGAVQNVPKHSTKSTSVHINKITAQNTPEITSSSSATRIALFEGKTSEDLKQPDSLLQFPCKADKGSATPMWPLTQDFVEHLRSRFPQLDVLTLCQDAHDWVLDCHENRKTWHGMRSFLRNWMKREQPAKHQSNQRSPERNHNANLTGAQREQLENSGRPKPRILC